MRDLKEELKLFFRQQGELFFDEFYLEKSETLPPALMEQLSAEPSNMDLSFEELQDRIITCEKCPLSQTRTKAVPGYGNRQAELMFIGEAPGQQEDLQGLPFVGRAGQLLDKILAAIDLKREQVFIANILKCRPPNNRTPHADEIAQCEPYLVRQIELIRPKLIICLGLTAAKTLLRVEYSLGQMRGEIYSYHGVDLIVTYHPAALLRNPNLKRDTWEDFKKIQKLYLEKARS